MIYARMPIVRGKGRIPNKKVIFGGSSLFQLSLAGHESFWLVQSELLPLECPMTSPTSTSQINESKVSSTRSARLSGRVVCALAYVAAFLVLASVLRHWFGFPLDDSWIHEVVARNLAEFKVLGFTPGKLSSGSTSLLWTAILAVRALLFPMLSPVIYCAGISVVVLAGIGFVLKSLAEQDGVTGGASWCLALAPALSGNFLWFGLIGMEHLLFILLSLCVVIAWFSADSAQPQKRSFLLPLLCFLLVLTRPEGCFLPVLLFFTRRSSGRSVKQWLSAITGTFCGGLLFVCVNWMTGHHLAPLTMQGRKGLPQPSWWLNRLQFLGHTVARMVSTWGITIPHRVLHGHGLLIGLPLIAVLAALLFLAVRRLRSIRASRFLLLSAWGGFIEVLYFFMMPMTGHGGRYVALPIMLFLSLVFFGLHEALVLLFPRTRVATIGVWAVGVVTLVVSLTAWRAAATADIEQINTEHAVMAQWIEQNLPPEAISNRRIAVYDIGRIGYQFHGNIIDLGGLVDSTFHPYLAEGRTVEYLQKLGVEYVVLPMNFNPMDVGYQINLSINREHGADLTPVHTVCADRAVSTLAITSSETAMPCQRLYTIRYLSQSTQ